MRFSIVMLALVWLSNSALAQPMNLAQATAGYLYFNRNGATVTEHDSDLRTCAAVASNNYLAAARALPARPPLASRGIVEDWIGGIVNDSMLSGWERAHRNIVIENCMVVRGWRLVRIDDRAGRSLAALGHDELRGALSNLIGAAAPTGEVVRIWRNEAADPGSIYAISPRNARRTLLSVLAADTNATLPQDVVRFLPQSEIVEVRIERAQFSNIPTLRPHEAIIVVGLTGLRSRARHFFMALEHEDGSRSHRVWVNVAGAENIGGGRFKNTLAFVVPAGEWRLRGFGMHLDFCLGAPSFTVAGSEIVFAGEFDSDAVLRPDLSEAAVHRHAPTTAPLATSIRPANWTNGATWACPPFNVYALELAGAPFRPDYRWGSAVASPQDGAEAAQR